MDPMVMGLICAAVFGTVMVASAFIRQLLLSRDKKLNDEAQSRALAQEASELEKIRIQMQNEKRFTAHYQMLGDNKDAIKYLDNQIEELLNKKTELIERYAQATIKESGVIISSGEVSPERKLICDKLRDEIDKKITFYDSELQILQKRRAILWDTHTDFERYLLNQEKASNVNLDNIYKQHSALLEKVYLRHIDDTEVVAVKLIDAGTMSFKDMLMAPIQFLMQFFGAGSALPSVAVVQTRVEHSARQEVERAEHEINNPDERSNLHRQAFDEQNSQGNNVRSTSVSFAL
ncbi:hypothetical protein J2N86_05470 [Legionella lytica]|uniref:Uncharacterized protein n=1 Tax=Legionella lytica TaxID=96232 RepID=A0ABY4YBD6_9GAMM|nr:hypothetical protein [Legionella lytica]USQ14751.1 hypothetical protein J2N86_05470 [Legionella lytica]